MLMRWLDYACENRGVSGAAGHDEVDAAANQVGDERGKAIIVPIGRAIFDLQVLPFYIAVLVKAAQQSAEIRLVASPCRKKHIRSSIGAGRSAGLGRRLR
jgi:hypothetical protein